MKQIPSFLAAACAAFSLPASAQLITGATISSTTVAYVYAPFFSELGPVRPAGYSWDAGNGGFEVYDPSSYSGQQGFSSMAFGLFDETATANYRSSYSYRYSDGGVNPDEFGNASFLDLASARVKSDSAVSGNELHLRGFGSIVQNILASQSANFSGFRGGTPTDVNVATYSAIQVKFTLTAPALMAFSLYVDLFAPDGPAFFDAGYQFSNIEENGFPGRSTSFFEFSGPDGFLVSSAVDPRGDIRAANGYFMAPAGEYKLLSVVGFETMEYFNTGVTTTRASIPTSFMNVELDIVPEPGSGLLVLIGALVFAARRRRTRSADQSPNRLALSREQGRACCSDSGAPSGGGLSDRR